MVPDEICEECGNAISKKAIAHVFDDRVVCTTCIKKLRAKRAREELERERAAIEAARKLAREQDRASANAPTEKQIAYATCLGIIIPEGISKWDLSALISKATGEDDE